jgi:hypothetical protein
MLEKHSVMFSREAIDIGTDDDVRYKFNSNKKETKKIREEKEQ